MLSGDSPTPPVGHHVGQDEIVILLEMDESNQLLRDPFLHLNDIFWDADEGKATPAPNKCHVIEMNANEMIRLYFQVLQSANWDFLCQIIHHSWAQKSTVASYSFAQHFSISAQKIRI